MSDRQHRLAIFAHWDKDCMVDPYVIYYLEALSKVAEIVFVSDCELPQEELAKVEPFTIARIAEPHGEYDFGSYKKGYLHAADRLGDYEELIFANDSCYGPFSPFEELWEKMDAKACDFWGIFEHYHIRAEKWHVQSFFLVFKRGVFLSQQFHEFIQGIRAEREKEAVIVKYEVGLSDTLIRAGYKAASLCARSTENLTHHGAAFEMLSEEGSPLLKKALLARNPLRSPMLIKSFQKLELELQNSSLPAMICANLQRSAGSNYRNHWFHTKLIKGHLLHPKLFRYKEKALRWMNVLGIKLAGITVIFIPWKINFKRIAYDLQHQSDK